MSDPLPPDLICPGCGEMRQIESKDEYYWICNVCTFQFAKDRPTVNENDRQLLKRHHRMLGGKPKPWGTY